MMSKRGFFAMLKLLAEKESFSLESLQDYLTSHKILDDKNSFLITLHALENLGMIKKNDAEGTAYSITYLGKRCYEHLEEIAKLLL